MRLIIYQDRTRVLVNEVFYHTAGFRFDASKGHEYLIRVMKNGADKLVVMDIENYIAEGRTQEAISAGHIDSHEKRVRSIRSKMGVRILLHRLIWGSLSKTHYLTSKLLVQFLNIQRLIWHIGSQRWFSLLLRLSARYSSLNDFSERTVLSDHHCKSN